MSDIPVPEFRPPAMVFGDNAPMLNESHARWWYDVIRQAVCAGYLDALNTPFAVEEGKADG